MYYFAVFLVVLSSSHILAYSRYEKKRIYSDIGHNSEDCDDPYHAHKAIMDDESLINAMSSAEYLAHQTRARVKAARIRRLRKLKRLSDSDWNAPLFVKNRMRNDGIDRNDINSEQKSVNKNINENINRNVKSHKKRLKVSQIKTITPRDELELIQLSDRDEPVKHHNRDRTVEFAMENPRKVKNTNKHIDRDPKHSSGSANEFSTSKNNVSLEVEDLKGVTTSSTPKSTVGVNTAGRDIDAENASGDIERSPPMKNEDIRQDILKKRKQDRLRLKKQRDRKRKRHSKSRASGKTREVGTPRVEKGKRVNDDPSKDSRTFSESHLSLKDSEESYINNSTTKSPLKEDGEQDLSDNLDERNQTIPNLRRMFPKFKSMKRIRGPQWSGSDLLMYALDAAKTSNSDTAPATRILQDTIDPEYLPEIFKPTKRTRNLNKNEIVNENKNVNKKEIVNKNKNVNKNVNVNGGAPTVPLTHRPLVNKYRARPANTRDSLQASDTDDDDNDDNDDDDDERLTETSMDRNNINKNVNRNVNVNVNNNNHRDSVEHGHKQINFNKLVSNRRTINENLNLRDAEPVEHRNVNKNVNVNGGAPTVPLTHRPLVNKYRARPANKRDSLQTSDSDDDDNDDNDDDDDDDERLTETSMDRNNINKNVNRNVNVNVNKNSNRDSLEPGHKQINFNKLVSNRRTLNENFNLRDTEPVEQRNVNKNQNVNINRNVNRHRAKPHELTQKELDNLLKKYEEEENRSYIHQSSEYY